MAVLNPIRVTVRDFPTGTTSVEVPDFPFEPSRGSHTVPIEPVIFIDQADFRVVDDADYFGLAPGKIVGLKYAFVIKCESFETNEKG